MRACAACCLLVLAIFCSQLPPIAAQTQTIVAGSPNAGTCAARGQLGSCKCVVSLEQGDLQALEPGNSVAVLWHCNQHLAFDTWLNMVHKLKLQLQADVCCAYVQRLRMLLLFKQQRFSELQSCGLYLCKKCRSGPNSSGCCAWTDHSHTYSHHRVLLQRQAVCVTVQERCITRPANCRAFQRETSETVTALFAA